MLLAACDAAPSETDRADGCPFPVRGFAPAPQLFRPGEGDTLRVGERFFLSTLYNGERLGGNHALAVERAFTLTWTPPSGDAPQVLYEWAGTQGPEVPTTRFIVEVLTTLRFSDGSPTAAQLDGGTFAFEIAVDVESVACGGLDRTSLVTRNRVAVE